MKASRELLKTFHGGACAQAEVVGAGYGRTLLSLARWLPLRPELNLPPCICPGLKGVKYADKVKIPLPKVTDYSDPHNLIATPFTYFAPQGIESPYRYRPVEDSLRLFEEMRQGLLHARAPACCFAIATLRLCTQAGGRKALPRCA